MSLELAARTLKAAAEPSRLRLLLLLARGEATVGELQEILAQSQPRVSRHLRLLADAGLVTRFREGQSIYYRMADARLAVEIAALLRDATGSDDRLLRADADALDEVRRARQRAAFAGPALLAATQGGARPEPEALQAAMEDVLAGFEFRNALDVGCGGGALLPWLSERARAVTGADTARPMRLLARARTQSAGLANCTIRDADLASLPFADGEFDLVLLDEVLGRCADPARDLREGSRVLAPGGRLVILDRVEPAVRQLGGRPVLAENQLQSLLAAVGLRITERRWLPGRAMDYAAFAAAPAPSVARTGTDG